MPKRPRAHILAEKAVRAFSDALEPHFKLHERPFPEYGIDGDVEHFDEDGNATGLHFFTQIKGTDEPDLGKGLTTDLRRQTAAYLRAVEMPVLMVRYHAPTDRVYVRWFHSYDPREGRGGEKTVRFRWRATDRWAEGRAVRIVGEALAFYELRRALMTLPRPVHVSFSDGWPSVHSPAAVLLTLRAAARNQSRLIEIRDSAAPAGALLIEFRPDGIKVSLGEVTGASLEVDEAYAGWRDDSVLVADALTMLGLAFERVGQDMMSARLVASHLRDSTLAGDIEVAFAMSSVMARDGRVGDALRLADGLDDLEDPPRQITSAIFEVAARYAEDLSDDDRALWERVLRTRLERRKAAGHHGTGAAAFNLANFLRGHRRAQEAIPYFDEALKLDGAYRNRAHYWFERAGAEFLADDYGSAVDSYGRAIALGSHAPLAMALLADSLLFAGRYREALSALDAFCDGENAGQDDGEYRIKRFAAQAIVDKVTAGPQDRDTRAALAAAPSGIPASPEGQIASGVKQLSHDALWGAAWFNMGLGFHELADDLDAARCFTVATVLSPTDPEAIAFAALMAIRSGQPVLAGDLIVTSRRRAGDATISEVVEVVRTKAPGLADNFEEFTSTVLFEARRKQGVPSIRYLSGTEIEQLFFGAEHREN